MNSLRLPLLLLGGLLCLLPLWIMLVLSLSENGDNSSVLNLWPTHWSWQAYKQLWHLLPLALYAWNSLMVAITTTVLHLLVCALSAYGLSRYHFKGQRWILSLFLLTMMVPIQVNIIPLFLLMKRFHWINTPWALILPGCFGAFGILFLTEWLNGIPRTLDEAACLDGCTSLQTWWHVLLPVCRPALVTIALLTFINTWNSFLWPLLVSHSDTVKTLPVAIASLKSSYREAIDWPVLMAATTISTIPLLLLFLIGQRYLLGSMTTGSLKE